MVQMTFLQYRTKLVPQLSKPIKVFNSTFMNMTEDTISTTLIPFNNFSFRLDDIIF